MTVMGEVDSEVPSSGENDTREALSKEKMTLWDWIRLVLKVTEVNLNFQKAGRVGSS